MNRTRCFLKKDGEDGFSYIEVMISMAIFSISIVPILSMVFNASKTAILGKRYYEAAIVGQNLLEEVKRQIEKNLVKNMPIGQKGVTNTIDLFLEEYDQDSINDMYGPFKGNEYNYELYILETNGDTEKYQLLSDPLQFRNLYAFVHINGGNTLIHPTAPIPAEEFTVSSSFKEYFSIFDETSAEESTINFGYDGVTWTPSGEYSYGNFKINLMWDHTSVPPSYKIIVDDEVFSAPYIVEDKIKLNLDVSKLDSNHKLNIKIENKTTANVIFSIYRLTADLDKNIEVFPIQDELEGNIFIERKTKTVPKHNYIIRIIVRDRKTSKILKNMVDIYVHDYRITAD